MAGHLNGNGVFIFDITTVGHLMAVASAPRMTQQFGDNYLLIRVRRAHLTRAGGGRPHAAEASMPS